MGVALVVLVPVFTAGIVMKLGVGAGLGGRAASVWATSAAFTQCLAIAFVLLRPSKSGPTGGGAFTPIEILTDRALAYYSLAGPELPTITDGDRVGTSW